MNNILKNIFNKNKINLNQVNEKSKKKENKSENESESDLSDKIKEIEIGISPTSQKENFNELNK